MKSCYFINVPFSFLFLFLFLFSFSLIFINISLPFREQRRRFPLDQLSPMKAQSGFCEIKLAKVLIKVINEISVLQHQKRFSAKLYFIIIYKVSLILSFNKRNDIRLIFSLLMLKLIASVVNNSIKSLIL